MNENFGKGKCFMRGLYISDGCELKFCYDRDQSRYNYVWNENKLKKVLRWRVNHTIVPSYSLINQ